MTVSSPRKSAETSLAAVPAADIARKRIAVVGGGIFGVSAALELVERGHKVELFERSGDLLSAASGINQYRLHRGYHYPRSASTARECKATISSFVERYGSAVVDTFDHHYAVAGHDSLTSAAAFEARCQELDLELESSWPQVVRRGAMENCFRVAESLIDIQVLRQLCWEYLRGGGVMVHLNTHAESHIVSQFDCTVFAAYASNNELLDQIPEKRRHYQFEVCEKPVVILPPEYRDLSIVVIDGPFMCMDPLGRSGSHVLGHVVHAIHHSNVGLAPEVPVHLQPLLNRGTVKGPPATKFDRFVDVGKHFFNGFENVEHVGSMFTIRSVLPNLDATDARPTVVEQLSDRVVRVFSGKLGTCVAAARKVADFLSGVGSRETVRS